MRRLEQRTLREFLGFNLGGTQKSAMPETFEQTFASENLSKLNEWFQDLKARCSERTLKSYKSYLNEFIKFLGQKQLENVTYSDVRAYLNQLAARKVRLNTIKCQLCAIRSLYTYLQDCFGVVPPRGLERITVDDYASKVPEPVPREALSREEIRKLIGVTKNLRDSLIIAFLYSTGARVREASNVKLCDIDRDKRLIAIHRGKGSKSRVIPYPDRLSYILDQWLDVGRKAFLKSRQSEYLFVSKRSEKLSTNGIQKIVHRAAIDAKIQKKYDRDGGEPRYRVTPHVLRHTFATHLLEDGVPVNYVRLILGHESINTTMIYAHESLNRVFDSYYQNFRGWG